MFIRTPLLVTLAGLSAIATLYGQAPAPNTPPAAAATGAVEPALTWHRPAQWGVEGRAFMDLDRLRWYDRLPAVAEGKVTDAVWNLSRDSAGMMVRFKTDASTIWRSEERRVGKECRSWWWQYH